ncbi:BAG family molecular chaperone regulator 6 [Capsicum chacoense]
MYPMNRFMYSHPYQRNQGPYNPYYCSHFEPNPHHMNIDPTRSTLPYESWPSGGNYGHPYPHQCHSCCIHNNSPSQCAFRPPYPYHPPPAFSNCSYPTYPMMYPAQYAPPHFNMEQPRYEYEKNMDRDHHCCGCPNHLSSSKKGGSNVKIEEHDQDNLDKRNESNESLVPLGFKNGSYPVVWLPPDDMKIRERMKPNGSNCKEQEENPQVVKPFGDFGPFQQPNVWNVWPPHHGNNSESPKQKGDLPGKQHDDDAIRQQFPFPIIWMPYKLEEDADKINKEADSGPIAKQELTSPSKLTKPMIHDSEDRISNSKENEVNSGNDIRGKGLNKEAVVKTIPVKQVEQNEVVLNGKKQEASQRHDSDAKEKKITQDGGKKQSSSPTKSSKLPPVCLRVDPLPRKKSSNGSSRSPSPPGGKGKLVESPSDSSKSRILSNEEENVQLDKSSTTSMPGKSVEAEPSKSKIKVVEVAQGTTKEDKLQDQCTVFPDLKCETNELKDQPDKVAAKAQSSNERHQAREVANGEAANGEADAGDKMKREKKRKMSDDKAATMIQSAYRGFNVRRWEPLTKLKQIAKIEEQMAGLKNRVQALESSADSGVDNKQRTIMTEVIMGLLLKLDTIQGLHPTVREYRKSVAKELVSLQEKLDLLNCMKQPAESEQTLTAKSSEDTCTAMEDNISLQQGLEVQNLKRDDDLAKGNEEIKFDSKGPSEEQPLCVTEKLANSHDDIGNAEVLMGKKENKDVGEVMLDFSGGNAVETGDGASETPFEAEEKADDKVLDENAAVVEQLEEHDESEQSLPNTIPFSEELSKSSASEVTHCGFKNDDGVDELEELPRGVLDEETSVQDAAEIRKDEVLQYDKGDLIAHVPEGKVSDTESLEHHPLKALGEIPVIERLENTHSSNKIEENTVLERDAAVLIDIPKQDREDATSLNEDENISDVDDKVAMEKNDKELEQNGTASDGLSQSQKGAITSKQPTDSTNMEQLEIIAGLQEKMQNAVDNDAEILDSGKTMEQTAEPQQSTITNDEFQEYHFQKVGEENMEVKGEEFSARDAVVSVPDNEGKEHNVDVEQRHEEQNLETQEKEPVAADNAAPVTEEPVEGSKAMATPTSTELAGEKELGAGEDHSTYPLTGDAVEDNSADVAHSFGSTPTEVQIMDANELKEWKKVGMSPSTPTASQVSCDSDALSESDRKLIEENEKLREMLEKLIKSGNEQLTAISSLSGRVKHLEKRLSRKKKLGLKRNRMAASGSACVKPLNDSLRDRAVGLAM